MPMSELQRRLGGEWGFWLLSWGEGIERQLILQTLKGCSKAVGNAGKKALYKHK